MIRQHHTQLDITPSEVLDRGSKTAYESELS